MPWGTFSVGVVIHHRLEIHLALPVSGNFDLMLDRGASPTLKRNICRPVDRPRVNRARAVRFLPIDGLSRNGPLALQIQGRPNRVRAGSLDLPTHQRANLTI